MGGVDYYEQGQPHGASQARVHVPTRARTRVCENPPGGAGWGACALRTNLVVLVIAVEPEGLEWLF